LVGGAVPGLTARANACAPCGAELQGFAGLAFQAGGAAEKPGTNFGDVVLVRHRGRYGLIDRGGLSHGPCLKQKVFLGTLICRRPSGAFWKGWALYLGLAPQATCLGSFGALVRGGVDEMEERMRPRNRLVRLMRALSGETQKELAERTGIHPTLLARYELDQIEPGPENLELAAREAGLTVAAGEEILRLADTLRHPRKREGQGAADLVHELLASLVSGVYRRLLRLPLPAGKPTSEDRLQAGDLWLRLKDFSESRALAVIRIAREFQTWALVERLCEESVVQASRDVNRAGFLARLAREIAERVPGPEGWRQRVRAFAAAHVANVLRVAGKLKAAADLFEEVWRLWHAGADPGVLLDPGRLFDLEASLCRDQRRFDRALALLEQAQGVSRCPGHTLISKGFTLDVMGEYERAIETLLEAKALPEVQADPRLCNILHNNLALDFCHVGRFAEASELTRQVRLTAAEMGDAIGILRVTWIDALIAAGLGRISEALSLLAHARQQFADRNMGYDVALALLEEAALLLDEGRTAEVKELTRDLPAVFEAEEVHREALAALRLFHEAAEREAATAELARRVLRYLFRARHDEGFQFAG
jgi:transcriptional regulator with XRE-family HTH domain